ncbi:ABC transporter permease [Oceanobacillus chungangensis]|uniref:ABC transporter permease n=1 Tax=Oceanobacillus chungangensis TaxID=1229152 RepID=A0A3D8PYD5_9BACI|nr:ABC transporter permease [Oceanobacillus chungangensis]RDW19825.1 ABC transporter permease [Oceanobacillus chungangensis]
MVGQIVKKQLLLLLRSPVQLLLLIGLPIILIAILGTALSSFMEGEALELDLKVALIEEENEEEQIERFMKDVEELGLPEEAVGQIQLNIAQAAPIQLLKESVFGNEAMKDVIELDLAESEKLKQLLADDSYSTVIEVPNNFTYDMLNYMVFEEGVQPSLQVYQNEAALGATVVQGMLEHYQEQFAIGSFISKNGLEQLSPQIEQQPFGEIVSINQDKPASARDYYAIGMAVMNVLFIASTIGTFAFLEKKDHVFNRIILANVSRWTYFIGIFLSGMIIGFLHLLIIFGFSRVFYGVIWPDLFAFFVVTLAFAIAVGGLSVLLTAICYRINSEMITNFFSNIVVTIFATLGGSFFALGELSSFIQLLGDLTPNGAAMSAYLDILRGESLADISNHLLFLAIFAVALIVAAAFSFPKRGSAA